LGEIDATIRTEHRQGLSSLGIERDHLCKRRKDHDAFVVAIAPIGDAAMPPSESGDTKTVFVDFEKEGPFDPGEMILSGSIP